MALSTNKNSSLGLSNKMVYKDILWLKYSDHLSLRKINVL